MSSLLVRGGRLVSELGVQSKDVLIRSGKVLEVLDPGREVAAEAELDATGLHVLPGLIDAHVHFNEPGRTDWEGFLSGTAAAAAGGVTTVLDMPLNCHPPTLDARALALKRAAIVDRSHVDYGFWGGVVPDSLDHLGELQQHGVVGVKAFLCDSGLADYPPLDDFALLETMQRCADLGLLLALHAEDPNASRAVSGREPIDWARSRPPEMEVTAVRRALDMARETGARLHFVHISTGAAARLIAEARDAGQDVSSETCPHYLALTERDLQELGSIAKCAPPLRSSQTQHELWQAVCDGAVDLIASDHSPCPPDMKATSDIWSAWGGIAGVQTLLPVLLTQARLPLEQVVRLTSAAPARRFGLHPRKGALVPGSDADLVLVDVERSSILRSEDLLTRWQMSPFIGKALRGSVAATMVRGTLVYRTGSLVGEPGHGRAA
jgi:allantoinase